MSEYSIFMPKTHTRIMFDYPELRAHDCIRNLRSEEILFTWYFACEASPLQKRYMTDRDRCIAAMDLSYYQNPKKPRLRKEEHDEYLAGNFPHKIQLAIDLMSAFRVGPRVRAKKMIESGLDKLEEILNIKVKDDTQFQNKDGEIDFSKKKAYVDTLAKAVEILPKIINTLEGGFGVVEGVEEKDDTMSDGKTLIDEYHEKQE